MKQQAVLLRHCGDSRFVWNLAVEQGQHWRPGWAGAPTYTEQSRQLTEARADNPWLAAGSVIVQQQSLRDYSQAMANFFAKTHRKPTWRKAGRHEGFRIVAVRRADINRVSSHVGQLRIPKGGWVPFRWSRAVPDGVKSYRITLDASGRWHVAFATIPVPRAAPGNGEVVGVDRGVVVSAALSTGELLTVPRLSPSEKARLLRLQRRLARAKRGSSRRNRARSAVAKLKARERDRRKDWVEKTSTDLARRFDVVRVEDLKIANMTRSAKGTAERPGRRVRQKASLNREISRSGWGHLIRRLDQKAPGRVQRVNSAFTSQRCSACGHVDQKSRKNQACFRCTACGYTLNADVNAAVNIATAAGRAAAARGGPPLGEPANREPRPLAS